MVDPLRRVLVKRPDEAFAVEDPTGWGYTASPDLAAARKEHDFLVKILEHNGAEVLAHDEPQLDRADAIYVFDPVLMTDEGAVVLNLGKASRQGEEEVMKRRLRELDVPILFELEGGARAEGGDLLWLDAKTLAIGQGFRTNPTGFHQLREGLAKIGVQALPVSLPFWHGPTHCLHLLSLISFVDQDLAVGYPALLSVAFCQHLSARKIRLIEVPEEELPTQGPNVLALAPSKVVMLEGNPVTQRRLQEAGCEVWLYQGREISIKGEGGPTCLTRPIWRQA